MFSDELIGQAGALVALCLEKNKRIATAESCTGGLIAALLTEIAGASSVFERGFITYSNQAKQDLLSVSFTLLDTYGAVSEQVAGVMATGALRNSKADIAISVTGIAGPGGGTLLKPVGLVYIGYASAEGDSQVQQCNFSGSRCEIRYSAVSKALAIIKGKIC